MTKAEMMEMMEFFEMYEAFKASKNGGVQVANAAVVPEPVAQKPVSAGVMSLSDVAAKLTGNGVTEKPAKDLSGLELVYDTSAKCLKLNMGVPSDIWTANHIALKKYGAKYNKRRGGWTFNSQGELLNCCNCFAVVRTLDDAQKAAIAEYRKEQAAKRAEYYTGLANK